MYHQEVIQALKEPRASGGSWHCQGARFQGLSNFERSSISLVMVGSRNEVVTSPDILVLTAASMAQQQGCDVPIHVSSRYLASRCARDPRLHQVRFRTLRHPRNFSAWLIFERDRKSTRLNSSHVRISYAVFCLKKKKK